MGYKLYLAEMELAPRGSELYTPRKRIFRYLFLEMRDEATNVVYTERSTSQESVIFNFNRLNRVRMQYDIVLLYDTRGENFVIKVIK